MNMFMILSVVLTFACRHIEGSTTSDHSPLIYNFNDVLAQSACTAKAATHERIWAMRRNCAPSGTMTCHDVCNRKSLTCFQAFFVYKNPKILAQNADSDPDEAVDGLSIFNYLNPDNGCAWQAGHCGPNYCCCSGHWNAI